MTAGQLERGKKWSMVIAETKFRKKPTKWFEEQQSIMDDVKAYEDSLQKETKSKKEK